MPAASRKTGPLTTAESEELLAPLLRFPAVALAVSGGGNSMALMTLVAAWARARPNPPRLAVLTVDDGLRHGSAAEAQKVANCAAECALQCHLLTWNGAARATGVQAAAGQRATG